MKKNKPNSIKRSPARRGRFFDRMSAKQLDLVYNVIIWSGIVAAGTAVLYFGSRYVKSKISDKEKGRGFGDNKWATWADQIRNALTNDGLYFGTDETALRRVIIAIPSRQDFEKVERSYRKQFNRNMSADIRSDLSTSEYNEMLAIIQSKPKLILDIGKPIYDPKGWAKRLNAAFNYRTWGIFWGTDIEAIRAVLLEIPTQQAYLDTAKVYRSLYGVTLMSDAKGDLSSTELNEFTTLVKRKPFR